jgi:hypothetical protein
MTKWNIGVCIMFGIIIKKKKAEKITIRTGEPHSVITPMLVSVFIAQTNVLFIFFCIVSKGSNSMNSQS